MQLVLGVYTGEKAVLDKWTKTGSRTAFEGAVRGEVNVVNPSIMVQGHVSTFYNYAYIAEYDSYYYITEINDFRRDLSIIVLKRDGLQTFAGGIKASPAIAARASDDHVNADYPDPQYKTLQSNGISIIPFGHFGVSSEIIFGFVK